MRRIELPIGFASAFGQKGGANGPQRVQVLFSVGSFDAFWFWIHPSISERCAGPPRRNPPQRWLGEEHARAPQGCRVSFCAASSDASLSEIH